MACCLLLESAQAGRKCCIRSICKCYNKLFKALNTGPTRACLPLSSSTFPAHQMDAPLLESLEGSGVLCFNWWARAGSYGVIFISEGLQRGSVGTVLQAPPWILNIIQLQLSDQLFFFSVGKVDEILTRWRCTMSTIGFFLSLEPAVLACLCAHLLCYLFPSMEDSIWALRLQALPRYTAFQVGTARCLMFEADTCFLMWIWWLGWT